MLKLDKYLLASIGLGLALGPVSAFATVVQNFSANILAEAPFTGNTYFGSFSYDETVLAGTGFEVLDPVFGAVTVNIVFEGQAFNQTNDVDFDEFPLLEFMDGVPDFLNFLLIQGSSGVAFNDPTVMSFAIDSPLIPDGGGGFTVDAVVTTVVPVPAAAWLLGSALLGLAAVKRKKT